MLVVLVSIFFSPPHISYFLLVFFLNTFNFHALQYASKRTVQGITGTDVGILFPLAIMLGTE